jgi:signal transduction histidine kinase
MAQPVGATVTRAHVRRASRPAPFGVAPRDQRWWRSREIDVIEDERRRLARDLHDEAGHRLTAASLKLDEIAQRHLTDPELRASLEYVRALVWECTMGLHDVAFNLRPAILADLGLAPALRSLVRRAQEATTIDLAVEVDGEHDRMPERVELAGFRIAQEALTNALKYANASRVTIAASFSGDGVVLEIVDDGVGFDLFLPDDDRPRLGLKGMQERVDLVGGKLRLRSRPGHGTTVWVKLPRDEVV